MFDKAKYEHWGEDGWLPDEVKSETLTYQEKELRVAFVEEYFKDYNYLNAALRVGFDGQHAMEWSKKFQQDSFVQMLIAEKQEKTSLEDEDNLEKMKARTLSRLLQEANYEGPGSSHAARVNALGKAAFLLGMDTGEGTNVTMNMGGVMISPGIASVDAFEAEAEKQQEDLVTKTRNAGAN